MQRPPDKAVPLLVPGGARFQVGVDYSLFSRLRVGLSYAIPVHFDSTPDTLRDYERCTDNTGFAMAELLILEPDAHFANTWARIELAVGAGLAVHVIGVDRHLTSPGSPLTYSTTHEGYVTLGPMMEGSVSFYLNRNLSLRVQAHLADHLSQHIDSLEMSSATSPQYIVRRHQAYDVTFDGGDLQVGVALHFYVRAKKYPAML
ncbi:MAG TPA: hypothetical protein VHI13_09480 [Candidatus Kapabacteria bacterium]|nr:hypothetical protein [Candidatus Kapabacteria bacterium]